jgi:2-aminomuconate deaminase
VLVTNLSNRYEVAEIDPAQDRISSSTDDEWNRKILEMLGEGRLEDVAQVAREFGREANADMGFKGIWWLSALMGENNLYDGKVWDYQPVWGTGCALVELTPSPNKQLDFEKEFDEGPAMKSGETGGGLETHNVLADGHYDAPAAGESSIDIGPDNPTVIDRPRAVPDIILTEKAAPPVGPYPHARKVGDLLFLSGIGKVVDHDIEIQTRAVIDNLRAILEEAGSSLENILDVTVYLTDMQRDFKRFNEVYGESFATIQPTRTTVGVDSLPTQIAVELKVIAAAR